MTKWNGNSGSWLAFREGYRSSITVDLADLTNRPGILSTWFPKLPLMRFNFLNDKTNLRIYTSLYSTKARFIYEVCVFSKFKINCCNFSNFSRIAYFYEKKSHEIRYPILSIDHANSSWLYDVNLVYSVTRVLIFMTNSWCVPIIFFKFSRISKKCCLWNLNIFTYFNKNKIYVFYLTINYKYFELNISILLTFTLTLLGLRNVTYYKTMKKSRFTDIYSVFN